jgi:hypothetical protein
MWAHQVVASKSCRKLSFKKTQSISFRCNLTSCRTIRTLNT